MRFLMIISTFSIILLITLSCEEKESCSTQIPSSIEFQFLLIDRQSDENLFFGDNSKLSMDSLLFTEDGSESSYFSVIQNRNFFLEDINPDNANFSFAMEYANQPLGIIKVTHDGSEITCDWGKDGINQGIQIQFKNSLI